MLTQIMTVDRSKRPAAEIEALAGQLRRHGHEVVVHHLSASERYADRSGHIDAVIDSIWNNHRVCFQYARDRHAPYTLVIEDDCEIEDVAGIEIAAAFLLRHAGEVDLFFLGASPNCWWSKTEDRRVIRYSHVYWWHAVIFSRSFIDRYDVPKTWTEPNDLYFSKLVAAEKVAAFGLRRQVAFQKDRRNRFAETVLYGCPWGDGRRLLGAILLIAACWIALRTWT